VTFSNFQPTLSFYPGGIY